MSDFFFFFKELKWVLWCHKEHKKKENCCCAIRWNSAVGSAPGSVSCERQCVMYDWSESNPQSVSRTSHDKNSMTDHLKWHYDHSERQKYQFPSPQLNYMSHQQTVILVCMNHHFNISGRHWWMMSCWKYKGFFSVSKSIFCTSVSKLGAAVCWADRSQTWFLVDSKTVFQHKQGQVSLEAVFIWRRSVL